MQSDPINNNTKKQPLTKEQIKTYEGFEKISNEEAELLLEAIDHFCRFVYAYNTKSKKERRIK